MQETHPFQPAPNSQVINQQPQPTQPFTPLAHSGEENSLVDLEAKGSKIFVWIKRILSIALIAQGLFHIYESLYFIFAEAPLLSEHLSRGMISRDEIIALTVQAAIQLVTASVNFFLAHHLTKNSEETAEYVDIFLGLALLIANAFIIDFFRQIDADIFVSSVFNSILMYGMVLPQRLIELLP